MACWVCFLHVFLFLFSNTVTLILWFPYWHLVFLFNINYLWLNLLPIWNTLMVFYWTSIFFCSSLCKQCSIVLFTKTTAAEAAATTKMHLCKLKIYDAIKWKKNWMVRIRCRCHKNNNKKKNNKKKLCKWNRKRSQSLFWFN